MHFVFCCCFSPSGSLNVIRKKKVYRGRLSYLVADNSTTEPKTMAVDSSLIDPVGSKDPDCFESTSSGVVLLSSSDSTSQDNHRADSASEIQKECPSSGGSLESNSEDPTLPNINLVGDSHTTKRSSLGFESECNTSIQQCCSESPSHTGQSYTTCQGANVSTELLPGANLRPHGLNFCTSSATTYEGIQQNVHNDLSQPQTDLLVPLSSPLPETWTTVEDNFLNVSFLSVPFLSRANIGDLNVRVGSGKISLLWIDGAASRLDTLKVMVNSTSGKHVEMEQVKVIDVVAFRIEPITPAGIMTLDGEVVSYGPMQAQIHPHMGYVMSRNRRK